MTFIGSMSGALLVQHLQSDVLRQILPVLVICIGLYFLLMPKIGEEDRQRRLHGLPFALVAGAASALRWLLVRRRGRSTRWLCHAVRIQPGEIDGPRQSIKCHIEYRWVVAVCPRRQSDLGDRFCDAHWPVYWRTDGLSTGTQQRTKLIRPMIVIVSAVMSAKLLYDNHGQEILHWLGMN